MDVPSQIVAVRHAESELNELYSSKRNDALYHLFSSAYRRDKDSTATIQLAKEVRRIYGGVLSDPYVGITKLGVEQARNVGICLRQNYRLPKVVFISTYKRTRRTYEEIVKAWPELRNIPVVEDDALREQELGKVNLYGDFDAFFALNREERECFDMLGTYFYRFPGGENIPDVRQRLNAWLDRVGKSFSYKNILVVSHFATILALRANVENWSSEEFERRSSNTPKINCAVTEFTKTPQETGVVPEHKEYPLNRLTVSRFNEALVERL